MSRLKNLDVEFVSLVKRASSRDPADESEPQRFLLTKSDQRPSDVSDWREYSSRQAAVDEAVAGAHDDEDDEEENDEAAPTRAAIADMGKSDALADALTDLHRTARRENMNGSQRATFAKAARESELAYLKSVSPWSVATPVAKAADAYLRDSPVPSEDELLAKAARLQKSEGLSSFAALRKAAERR